MKISKRILGVALALIMIFNVFAVGSFAAEMPADTVVSLSLSTDKAVYKQGDEVIITFSEQCASSLKDMMIGGQYEIAYNSAVLEPYSTSTKLSDHAFTPIQAGSNVSYSAVQIPANSSGASALYDWDSTICYQVLDDGATTFDATAGVELFSIKMKIKADAADGTYTIGFNPQGYEDYNAFSNDGIGLGGLYGTVPDTSYMPFTESNMYAYGTVTFTVGEVDYDVYHVQNQYRPNGDNYDIGVKFGFKAEDIAIAFNEKGTSTNVSKVGADIYVNGEIVPDPDELFTSRFVYDINGDGSEFHYRVIIAGLAKADTTEYTIKPYVIVDGNRVDGEEVTVSAAAIVPQA